MMYILKIILTATLFFVLNGIRVAIAQVSFHPVVGFAATNILNRNEKEEAVYAHKLHGYPSFGLLVDVGGEGARFTTGLQYVQYGRTLEFMSPQEGPTEDHVIGGTMYHCDVTVEGTASKTSSLQYIGLPLMLKYLGKSPKIKFYAAGGFQVSYLAGSSFTSSTNYVKTFSASAGSDQESSFSENSGSYREQLNTITIAAVADGGIQIPLNYKTAFTIGPHIEYGIADAYKKQPSYIDFWNQEQAYLPYKTFSIGITAGVIFTIDRRHTKVR
ncbi:MAG TPA: outer membrane beta-barrel protein [Chitinophagales bacterium]|nr:outer membrane beta-barrel protein [Chitinophagales bacterium]